MFLAFLSFLLMLQTPTVLVEPFMADVVVLFSPLVAELQLAFVVCPVEPVPPSPAVSLPSVEILSPSSFLLPANTTTPDSAVMQATMFWALHAMCIPPSSMGPAISVSLTSRTFSPLVPLVASPVKWVRCAPRARHPLEVLPAKLMAPSNVPCDWVKVHFFRSWFGWVHGLRLTLLFVFSVTFALSRGGVALRCSGPSPLLSPVAVVTAPVSHAFSLVALLVCCLMSPLLPVGFHFCPLP